MCYCVHIVICIYLGFVKMSEFSEHMETPLLSKSDEDSPSNKQCSPPPYSSAGLAEDSSSNQQYPPPPYSAAVNESDNVSHIRETSSPRCFLNTTKKKFLAFASLTLIVVTVMSCAAVVIAVKSSNNAVGHSDYYTFGLNNGKNGSVDDVASTDLPHGTGETTDIGISVTDGNSNSGIENMHLVSPANSFCGCSAGHETAEKLCKDFSLSFFETHDQNWKNPVQKYNTLLLCEILHTSDRCIGTTPFNSMYMGRNREYKFSEKCQESQTSLEKEFYMCSDIINKYFNMDDSDKYFDIESNPNPCFIDIPKSSAAKEQPTNITTSATQSF